jgi:hypothetical protein
MVPFMHRDQEDKVVLDDQKPGKFVLPVQCIKERIEDSQISNACRDAIRRRPRHNSDPRAFSGESNSTVVHA